METCCTAIIKVNAVRNPKSLTDTHTHTHTHIYIYIYIYTHIYILSKNQSIHYYLVLNGLRVNKEVGE